MEIRVPRAADIQEKAGVSAFGKPLITNVHRGLVAEAIVASALEPDWRWCSEDYSSWDFERADGAKLEVKQSAARQSWAASDAKPSACSFDIASRTGRWENGVDWIEQPGRSAHLYVFAHHPVSDDSADHRDPRQWRFYVVSTARLPDGKRIGIAAVRALADQCTYQELEAAVAAVSAAAMKSNHVGSDK